MIRSCQFVNNFARSGVPGQRSARAAAIELPFPYGPAPDYGMPGQHRLLRPGRRRRSLLRQPNGRGHQGHGVHGQPGLPGIRSDGSVQPAQRDPHRRQGRRRVLASRQPDRPGKLRLHRQLRRRVLCRRRQRGGLQQLPVHRQRGDQSRSHRLRRLLRQHDLVHPRQRPAADGHQDLRRRRHVPGTQLHPGQRDEQPVLRQLRHGKRRRGSLPDGRHVHRLRIRRQPGPQSGRRVRRLL